MAQLLALGFIGTGNMGSPIAANLLKAGYSLTVYDARRQAAEPLLDAGAKWGGSIAETAKASEVVLACMPRPSDAEAVALGEDGALAHMRTGSTFVDLTTNSPTVTRRIFGVGREIGVDVLDAAMSGGVHGAASRRMTLMVGGEEAVLARRRPILEAISDNVVHCGGIGTGTTTKVVNNMIALAVSSLVGEALILGVKAGVDLKTLTDTISNSTGQTWRMQHSFTKFLLKGNFAPGFALDLAVKDLMLGQGLAKEYGLDLDFLNLAVEKYLEAQGRGWGNLHSEAVVRLDEEKAGVELRIPESQHQGN